MVGGAAVYGWVWLLDPNAEKAGAGSGHETRLQEHIQPCKKHAFFKQGVYKWLATWVYPKGRPSHSMLQSFSHLHDFLLHVYSK